MQSALSGAAAPADFATGYAIAWGVCAALFYRQRTGRGQLIETSLLANALVVQSSAFMSVPAADADARAEFAADLAAAHEQHISFDEFVRGRKAKAGAVIGFGVYYRGYLTADSAVAVGCLSPSTRERFRKALDIEDPMQQGDGRKPPDEVIRSIERLFRGRTTAEWMETFDRFGVPASPVWFVEEMLTNPQVVENEYVIELDHDLSGPQWMAAPPLKMSDSPVHPRHASPPLGRDTRKWLTALGYSDDEISAMAESRAVGLG